LHCGCTGELGTGKVTEKPLHYQGTPIHRIVKDFMIQGGDFVSGMFVTKSILYMRYVMLAQCSTYYLDTVAGMAWVQISVCANCPD